MKTAGPLDILIEQSRKSRDRAGRILAEDQRDEQQALQQRQALQQYRQQYQSLLQNQLQNGMEIAALTNYRQFIQSLDHAIANAENMVEQKTQKVQSSKTKWRDTQKRLSSFNTLADRRAAREQRKQARQEQRRSDELVNNKQARRMAGKNVL